MLQKMVTPIFLLLILRSSLVNGGPFFGFISYWLCMSACTSAGGAIAAIMTAGIGTGAGVVYEAAACSSVCSDSSTAIFLLPGP